MHVYKFLAKGSSFTKLYHLMSC